MAGFFTSQCFHQGLSKAVIKKGDIITIKPQWQDAGDASFTWVARDDEENGPVKALIVANHISRNRTGETARCYLDGICARKANAA